MEMSNDDIGRHTWVIVSLLVAVIPATAAIGAAVLSRDTPSQEAVVSQESEGSQAIASNTIGSKKLPLFQLIPISQDALAGSFRKERITVTGVTTDNALVVDSQTACSAEQAYNLGSQFSKFVADVGIPDSVHIAGQVKFSVYLDGDSTTGYRAAYESVELGERKHIDVNTRKAFRLMISISGVCDDAQQAAWIDPTLVR